MGFVVVPQAMAYALLANLSPEYGLYTSFIGAALYWLFGTSKDTAIGVSNVYQPTFSKNICSIYMRVLSLSSPWQGMLTVPSSPLKRQLLSVPSWLGE